MHEATRRRYLVAAVGVAGLSGCQDALSDAERDRGDDGSDDDSEDTPESDSAGPKEVVETFYRALNQSAFEAANERLHSETLEQPVTEERYGRFTESELSVESVETIEDGESKVIVRSSVRILAPEMSEPITDSIEMELRTEDGEWRIYASGPRVQYGDPETQEPTPDRNDQSETGSEATGEPTRVVTEFYSALDAGDRTAANAQLHSEARVSVTGQAADNMADASLSVADVTLAEEGTDTATVEATVTLSSADRRQDVQNRVRIELRPEDGRWKLYSVAQVN
jgi:limonene-1,2-epoxide hydrolase